MDKNPKEREKKEWKFKVKEQTFCNLRETLRYHKEIVLHGAAVDQF